MRLSDAFFRLPVISLAPSSVLGGDGSDEYSGYDIAVVLISREQGPTPIAGLATETLRLLAFAAASAASLAAFSLRALSALASALSLTLSRSSLSATSFL